MGANGYVEGATMDNDFMRHAPGLGGALLAAMSKYKDGMVVVGVQFVMGAVPVLVLRPVIDWLSKKYEVPVELTGFGIGLIAVSVTLKVLETIMQLEFAKPFNERIARWTGARNTNPEDGTRSAKTTGQPPATEGPQP